MAMRNRSWRSIVFVWLVLTFQKFQCIPCIRVFGPGSPLRTWQRFLDLHTREISFERVTPEHHCNNQPRYRKYTLCPVMKCAEAISGLRCICRPVEYSSGTKMKIDLLVGVSMIPGAFVFTVMRCRPSSCVESRQNLSKHVGRSIWTIQADSNIVSLRVASRGQA